MRPTADRVKEAIFDLLGWRWEDERVLDLFAGSGALGIEALSRGANEAVFVEQDGRCLQLIRENLEACRLLERAKLIRAEALRFLSRRGAKDVFQVIFADPPYETGLASDCIMGVDLGGWLDPHGRLLVEHSRREEVPLGGAKGLVRLDQRSYGDTMISVYANEV